MYVCTRKGMDHSLLFLSISFRVVIIEPNLSWRELRRSSQLKWESLTVGQLISNFKERAVLGLQIVHCSLHGEELGVESVLLGEFAVLSQFGPCSLHSFVFDVVFITQLEQTGLFSPRRKHRQLVDDLLHLRRQRLVSLEPDLRLDPGKHFHNFSEKFCENGKKPKCQFFIFDKKRQFPKEEISSAGNR